MNFSTYISKEKFQLFFMRHSIFFQISSFLGEYFSYIPANKKTNKKVHGNKFGETMFIFKNIYVKHM